MKALKTLSLENVSKIAICQGRKKQFLWYKLSKIWRRYEDYSEVKCIFIIKDDCVRVIIATNCLN